MNETERQGRSGAQLFAIFLRLGLTSFGGPIAHIGYFRQEFVTRRRWLSELHFADLLSLCQVLPGPSSSQLGMAIGLNRCGPTGALLAWLGFTLPSAVLMFACARGLSLFGGLIPAGVLQGLQWVALAVVVQAVWVMAAAACDGALKAALALAAATAVTLWQGPLAQVAVLAAAAVIGILCIESRARPPAAHAMVPVSRRAGLMLLGTCAVLLLTLPLLARQQSGALLLLFDSFFRSGALVFGGGHVLLPLLHGEVLAHGWMTDSVFVAGYSAAQALPGPLFAVAAFVGASTNTGINPWIGGLISVIAIFAPSFLLVLGTAPFWEQVRRSGHTQSVLAALNAAVVGLLLAAVYRPIGVSTLHGASDVAFVLLALLSLAYWRLPVWCVVMGGAVCGALKALLSVS